MTPSSFSKIESEINSFLKLADSPPFNEDDYDNEEKEDERILINLLNPHLFNDLGINFKSIEENYYNNKLDKLDFYEGLTGDKFLIDSFLNFLDEVWDICESEKDSDKNKDKNIIKKIIILKQGSNFNLIKSFSKKLKIIFRLKINERTIRALHGYIISNDGTELIQTESSPMTVDAAIEKFAPSQQATTASKKIQKITKLADMLEEINSEIDYLLN